MHLESYTFSFLRYHHDPLSGEFANVGVLLWAPRSRYLGFLSCHKYGRLSQFFGTFQSDDYRALMTRVDHGFEKLSHYILDSLDALALDAASENARLLGLRIIPQDDGALRWSHSFGGLTDSPPAELEKLFHDTIGKHHEKSDESRRDEKSVYREIYRNAFENPHVKPFIHEHTVKAPLLEHHFQQAWKNGAWNVYEVISFDYKNAQTIQENALKWGHRAQLLADSPERPKIHFLLGNPDESHQKPYQNAIEILHRTGSRIIQENEAQDFARDLANRILASAES